MIEEKKLDLISDIKKLKGKQQQRKKKCQQLKVTEEKQKKPQQILVSQPPLSIHRVLEDQKPQQHQKSVEKKVQLKNIPKVDAPSNLFQGISFCMPIPNANLTKYMISGLSRSIQEKAGTVVSMEDLQEGFSVTYVLVDEKTSRKAVNKQIKPEKYKEILNVTFVKDCLKMGKIFQIDFYIIPKEEEKFHNEELQKIKNNLAPNVDPVQQRIPKEYKPGHFFQQIKKQNLLCQKKPGSFVFNKIIAEQLEKLQIFYEKKDRGKSINYARMAARIKSASTEITCEEDVDKLFRERQVGRQTAQKIKQLIKTGSMRKVSELQGIEENFVAQKLAKVWGIGPAKSKELYAKGIKSIEDLRQAVGKNEDLLTKNQKIGLKHYQQLSKRIPRDKVTKMFEVIKKVLFQLVGGDDLHSIEVCGSYRRGKETCGDMDVIITRNDGNFERKLLQSLIEQLEKVDFLTDHLTLPRHISPHNSMSYMGICKYGDDEGRHRIDIKYYPLEQYAYAILYFTGSEMFNRSMRLYAMKEGYCLSDHGMHKAEKISGGKILTLGQKIVCYSEQQIFKFLGLDFKEPAERSV